MPLAYITKELSHTVTKTAEHVIYACPYEACADPLKLDVASENAKFRVYCKTCGSAGPWMDIPAHAVSEWNKVAELPPWRN